MGAYDQRHNDPKRHSRLGRGNITYHGRSFPANKSIGSNDLRYLSRTCHMGIKKCVSLEGGLLCPLALKRLNGKTACQTACKQETKHKGGTTNRRKLQMKSSTSCANCNGLTTLIHRPIKPACSTSPPKPNYHHDNFT
jgi:hypothetical protein